MMNVRKLFQKSAGALLFTLAFIFTFSATAAETDTVKKEILYSKQGTQFQGFIVSPKAVRKGSPGILMIHNWMGVTDETIHQAERFARLGYTVLTADIYGKGVRPQDPTAAGTQAGIYKKDRKLFRERLNLALDQLKKIEGVDASKLAVVGYCFGGTGAIELARSGAPVAAVISFHGGLDSPKSTDGTNIKGHVLALHGAIDPYVSASDVDAFESEMKANKVDYQLVKYSGTVHSFTEVGAGTDISKGAAYNETSDKRSFLAAENFLNEIFTTAKK